MCFLNQVRDLKCIPPDLMGSSRKDLGNLKTLIPGFQLDPQSVNLIKGLLLRPGASSQLLLKLSDPIAARISASCF